MLNRRRFLKAAAVVAGGAAVLPAMQKPAQDTANVVDHPANEAACVALYHLRNACRLAKEEVEVKGPAAWPKYIYRAPNADDDEPGHNFSTSPENRCACLAYVEWHAGLFAGMLQGDCQYSPAIMQAEEGGPADLRLRKLTIQERPLGAALLAQRALQRVVDAHGECECVFCDSCAMMSWTIDSCIEALDRGQAMSAELLKLQDAVFPG
jgi:hypothetical protein